MFKALVDKLDVVNVETVPVLMKISRKVFGLERSGLKLDELCMEAIARKAGAIKWEDPESPYRGLVKSESAAFLGDMFLRVVCQAREDRKKAEEANKVKKTSKRKAVTPDQVPQKNPKTTCVGGAETSKESNEAGSGGVPNTPGTAE